VLVTVAMNSRVDTAIKVRRVVKAVYEEYFRCVRGLARRSFAVAAAAIPGVVLVSVSWDAGEAAQAIRMACPTAVGDAPTTHPPRGKARRGDIVFVSERSGAPEISVLNAATGAQARLTRRTPTGTDTAWSPDGSMIAFDRHYYASQAFSGHHELWLMQPDGAEPRALIRSAGRSLLMPAWSPDCLRLAYIRGGSELVIVDVRRGAQRTIVRAKWLGTPTWSPDGKRIAFARSPSPDFSYLVNHRSQIFIVGANGRGKRRLTNGGMPAWSPNGRTLAFVRERKIVARRLVTENELRVIDVDGRNGKRLTAPSRDRPIRDPAWSPDGKRLVVRRDSYGSDGGGLVVMDADGSGDHVVVPVSYWEYAGHPAWSPSGDTIVFDGGSAIYAVDAGGTNRRVLLVGNTDSDPSWSRDRQRIAFHRSPGYAPLGAQQSDDRGLYVVSSDGRSLQHITVIGYGDYDGQMPAWSPNGRWIAYMYGNAGIALRDMRTGRSRVLVCQRDPGGDCDGRGVFSPGWSPNSSEVFYWGTLDIDPMQLVSRRVTGRHGRFARQSPCTGEHADSRLAADWSPDGRWLLITSKNEVWRVPVGGCRLFGSRRPAGRGAKRLAKGRDAVWSPDGKHIAFVSDRDGDSEIYVMKSNGSHQRRVTRNVWDDVQPDW
jgi:TolB protein